MIEHDVIAMTDNGHVGKIARFASLNEFPRFDATELYPVFQDCIGKTATIQELHAKTIATVPPDWGHGSVVSWRDDGVKWFAWVHWPREGEIEVCLSSIAPGDAGRGVLMRSISADFKWIAGACHLTSVGGPGVAGDCYRDTGIGLRATFALFALAAADCKGVKVVDRRSPRKRRRQVMKRHGVADRVFKVLTLDLDATTRVCDYRPAPPMAAGCRKHWVKAYTRQKHGRTEFVPGHPRGNRAIGEVQKDYRIATGGGS